MTEWRTLKLPGWARLFQVAAWIGAAEIVFAVVSLPFAEIDLMGGPAQAADGAEES